VYEFPFGYGSIPDSLIDATVDPGS
jgi:hypothetical protein